MRNWPIRFGDCYTLNKGMFVGIFDPCSCRVFELVQNFDVESVKFQFAFLDYSIIASLTLCFLVAPERLAAAYIG